MVRSALLLSLVVVGPLSAADPAEFDKLLSQKRIARYSLTARQITLYLEVVRPGETVSVNYTLTPQYPLKVKTLVEELAGLRTKHAQMRTQMVGTLGHPARRLPSPPTTSAPSLISTSEAL